MTDAFSSNSDAVLLRGVDVTSGSDAPLENVEEQYQIKRTCDFINNNGFKKVDSGELLFFSFFFNEWCLYPGIVHVINLINFIATGCTTVPR